MLCLRHPQIRIKKSEEILLHPALAEVRLPACRLILRKMRQILGQYLICLLKFPYVLGTYGLVKGCCLPCDSSVQNRIFRKCIIGVRIFSCIKQLCCFPDIIQCLKLFFQLPAVQKLVVTIQIISEEKYWQEVLIWMHLPVQLPMERIW